MDEYRDDLKRIATLLRLAFGPQIRDNIDLFTRQRNHGVVLVLLAGAERDELSTGDIVALAKERGVARTQVFTALTELEQAGLLERRRRGFISLATDARPYVPLPEKTPKAREEVSSDATVDA